MSSPSLGIRGSFAAFRSWVAGLVGRFRGRRRTASKRVVGQFGRAAPIGRSGDADKR